jgi:hypothetical protein
VNGRREAAKEYSPQIGLSKGRKAWVRSERGTKPPSASSAEALPHTRRGTTSRGIIIPMRARSLTFAFFAAAILFSMIREWSAPSACARIAIDRAHLSRPGQ